MTPAPRPARPRSRPRLTDGGGRSPCLAIGDQGVGFMARATRDASVQRVLRVVRRLFYTVFFLSGGAESAWRRFTRASSVMILPRGAWLL